MYQINNKQFLDSSTNAPKIGIVIVNYNTPELTIDAVKSCENEFIQRNDIKLVVVDGASTDNSIEKLSDFLNSETLSRWVHFLALETNGGFVSTRDW